MKALIKTFLFTIIPFIYTSPLLSQPTLDVFFNDWRNCDFSRYQDSAPHHIQLIGDSNGSLYGAYPVGPLAIGYPGTTTPNKSWGKFLQPGPRTGGEWRVLNTAWPGNPSFFALEQLKHCLANPNNTPQDAPDKTPSTVSENLKRKYLASTPKRVWMQIGGNDLIYEANGLWTMEFMPHLAHYRINAILNNIGKMIELLQANGRSVVLASYFPLSTDDVRNADFKERPYEQLLCEPYERLYRFPDLSVDLDAENNQRSCMDVIDKFEEHRRWLHDRLSSDFTERMGFQHISIQPYVDLRTQFNKQLDMDIGRLMGLDTSFTGFFKNPAATLKRKYHRMLGNSKPFRLSAWDLWEQIIRSPRGIVGTEVAYALPNRRRAISAMVWHLGQRYRELYANMSVGISPNGRATVNFIDVGATFNNPHEKYGGKNEYYAEGIHINDKGFEVYGRTMAQFFIQWEYDYYLSDEEYVKAHQKDWQELPEDPGPEDLGQLLLCIYFGFCVY